jgi:hypothetical protein
VLGGFPQPLNSMLTQDEVMAVEPWPAPRPRALLYLSGPFGGGWSCAGVGAVLGPTRIG